MTGAPCSLGIDIGVTGGIAVVSAAGELIEVHQMPCLADGHAGRRAVNGPLLRFDRLQLSRGARVCRACVCKARRGRCRCFLFRPLPRHVEGGCAAAGVRCQFLTPPAWKRAVGLPSGRDKDASRAAAI